LVLDAGTGIHPLGIELAETDQEIFVLLTHIHTDHIFGFPFFAPLYQPGRTIHLFQYQANDHDWSLLSLFDAQHFPMLADQLPSDCRVVDGDPAAYLGELGWDVGVQAVNHPGGAYGYRVRDNGHTLVFIPDNEISPPDSAAVSYEELVRFCRDADVLCHDAQYLDEDLPAKRGWGHSLVRQVCRLALDARVKHLILFHHDIDRTDEELDAIHDQALSLLEPAGIACTVAYEGMHFEL
jgi:phosphoribosyl 1,2-cyclic phosphodiesterase